MAVAMNPDGSPGLTVRADAASPRRRSRLAVELIIGGIMVGALSAALIVAPVGWPPGRGDGGGDGLMVVVGGGGEGGGGGGEGGGVDGGFGAQPVRRDPAMSAGLTGGSARRRSATGCWPGR